MLMIRSDTINPTERPIINIKSDSSPYSIIMNIVSGEFKRNKSISLKNYEKSLNFINNHNINLDTQMSEECINSFIRGVLKILYDIKG